MSACVVRDATAKDYKAVLNLGTVYQGLDYLPYFYHDYITDPDCICNVCEVDGTIVGYQYAVIHDGGRVVQGKSRRVKAAYRGRGYNKAIENYFLAQIVKNPKIHIVLAFFDTDTINWADIQENPQKQHVLTMKLYKVTIPHPGTESLKPPHMKRLNETHLEAVFDCRTLCQDLFPHDLLFVSTLALGLDKSNMRRIINDDTSVYAKLSTESQHDQDELRPESMTSLSVGIRYWSPAGQICEISFYGKDIDEFDDHIQAQFEEISDCDFFIVKLLVPQFFPEKKLDDIYLKFSKHNGKKLPSETLSLIEMNLRINTAKSKY